MSVVDRVRPAACCRTGTVMIAAALLLTSCTAEPVAMKCSRYDAPSMGPENAFRIAIAREGAPLLDDAADHIDVALTLVPPVVGPVVLVHTLDGREDARWELKVGPDSGISTRCRLGATPVLSTCNVTMGNLPISTAGQWSVEPGSNRVLEAGLAFRTCR